jgi:hypothetical protein
MYWDGDMIINHWMQFRDSKNDVKELKSEIYKMIEELSEEDTLFLFELLKKTNRIFS